MSFFFKFAEYYSIMFRFFYFILFLLLFACKDNKQPEQEILQTIEKLQEESRTITDTNQLKKILDKGIILSKKINTDSTRINYKRKITCEYFNHKLLKPFYFHTKNNLVTATKINDSVYIAKLFLDLGDYHQLTYQIDSAYYYYRKALPFYSKVNKHQILTNYEIARLYTKENLNLESEVLIYQNLKNALEFKDPEIIQNFYILQGINYYETEQYDMALETFHTGFPYIDKIEVELIKNIKITYYSQFYLRIGMVYHKKKNYEQAKKYYNLALETLKKDGDKFIKGCALIYIEELNILQNKPINLNKCIKALELSTQDNIQDNIVKANHLFAKYYFINNNKNKALQYIEKSLQLAKELRLNYILYDIYTTLSMYDIKNKEKWLLNMLEIKELISQNERNTKNKFAKINYDTENVHQKALKLEKKVTNYGYIILIILLVAIIIFMVYRFISNNKIKKLDKLQKKANIEVYELLVEQHDLVEKVKYNEKSRISKELHDGIASELYGVRLGAEMDFIKNIEYRENLKKISENLRTLEKNVRNISHDLVNFSLSSNKLIEIIKDLVIKHEYYDNYKINFTFNEEFYEVILPNHLKINLYRIIQESITNIDKYSKAKNVIITIELKGKSLYLMIKDDGIGFNNKKNKIGIGLKNMNDRVNESKGRIRIASKINRGTIIQCVFDLSSLDFNN